MQHTQFSDTVEASSPDGLRIAFIHPDLGIGGAERLIVDAAVALQQLGHQPCIFTPFQDPLRTFPQVAPPNPQVPVSVVRPPIPRAILGRCQAILAALRCAFVTLYVCLFCKFDVAIVDLVSFPIFILHLFGKPSVFYCHFPDKLLAATLLPTSTTAPSVRARSGGTVARSTGSTQPSSMTAALHCGVRAYRTVIDWLDARAMALVTKTAVNSVYTARAFSTVYAHVAPPTVIHPCVHPPEMDIEMEADGEESFAPLQSGMYVLSLNRYERKKEISLAVRTLVASPLAGVERGVSLVIAGGYDPRVGDNVETLRDLRDLVRENGLEGRVTMLQNVTDRHRARLLAGAVAVLYTPSEEHFGIVPLEAMAAGVPVVAVGSAGPVESIVDGVTGFLCEAKASAFGGAVRRLVDDADLRNRMGREGRKRVDAFFSARVMGRELDQIVRAAVLTRG